MIGAELRGDSSSFQSMGDVADRTELERVDCSKVSPEVGHGPSGASSAATSLRLRKVLLSIEDVPLRLSEFAMSR
jgi:hypothetical protein